MAGPIQSAIAQAMGAVGGAALVGKNVADERAERQADEKARAEAEEKEAQKKAYAATLAKAVSYKSIAGSPWVWKNEDLIASPDDVAYVASQQSLYNYLSAKQKNRKGIKARIAQFKGANEAPATVDYKEEKKGANQTWGQK